MKAQNQLLGGLGLQRHSEGISYKPTEGEVGMTLQLGRMGPIK